MEENKNILNQSESFNKTKQMKQETFNASLKNTDDTVVNKKNRVNFNFPKNIIIQIIIVLIAIIVIIILLFTLKNPNKQNINNNVQTQDDLALAVGKMEPVPDGEFVYQFEGIDWIYENIGNNEIQVKMMFKNFSRHENTYITFGHPYRLGVYTGKCEESETLDIDPEKETGIALAFTTCKTSTNITEIALFQEWDNIVAKRRTYAIGSETLPPFESIYTITLTEIVK